MKIQEIEQAILDMFEKIYEKKYTGKLIVKELPTGTQVKLGLNCDEKPVVISADLKDEQFLEFFRKEVQTRHFELTHYSSGYKYETEQR